MTGASTSDEAVPSGDAARVAVSVILPAHNEAELLEAVVSDIVEGLREWGRPFEIRVMENGSSDATARIADDLSRTSCPEVRPHTSPDANYGKAVRQGLVEARGDIAVLFDVDYYDLPFLIEAVALLETAGDQRPTTSDRYSAEPSRRSSISSCAAASVSRSRTPMASRRSIDSGCCPSSRAASSTLICSTPNWSFGPAEQACRLPNFP
jgi:glycosyltransferase involved in cell wall biosynthesis